MNNQELGLYSVIAIAVVAIAFLIQSDCQRSRQVSLDAMKTCTAKGGMWIQQHGQSSDLGGNCLMPGGAK